MNIHDQETLRRIDQNDDTMKQLWIGDREFYVGNQLSLREHSTQQLAVIILDLVQLLQTTVP